MSPFLCSFMPFKSSMYLVRVIFAYKQEVVFVQKPTKQPNRNSYMMQNHKTPHMDFPVNIIKHMPPLKLTLRHTKNNSTSHKWRKIGMDGSACFPILTPDHTVWAADRPVHEMSSPWVDQYVSCEVGKPTDWNWNCLQNVWLLIRSGTSDS